MDAGQLLRDAFTFALKTTAVVSVVVAVVAGALVMLRTNSLHPFRTRLWHLVMGRRKCEQEDIALALRDRDDLIQFRHFLGIRARTVSRAAAIAAWARENDEEPADIYDCDDLFDRERCVLKEECVPGWLGLTFRGAGLACAVRYFIGPWAFLGLRSDQILVPVDQGLTTWLWISETSARPLWGSQVLTRENCPYGVKSQVPQWPEYGLMTSLCNSFADPGLKRSLAHITAMTRFLLFFLTAPFLPLFSIVVRWARAGSVAWRMRQRLHARRLRPTNMSGEESDHEKTVAAPPPTANNDESLESPLTSNVT